VCISILHAPGDDPNMYESSSERWSPVQSVEKILLSVLSMLAEPNDESGANIEACVSDPVYFVPFYSCLFLCCWYLLIYFFFGSAAS